MKLGATIHVARKRAKRTLHSLSEEVGISAGLLSLIEQDKHVPPKDRIVSLARALGADPDKWCGLVGKVTPDAEARLAKIASDDPIFFRSMLSKKRANHDIETLPHTR